jgi:ribonucleotide monophosphatase NagD (HAD superfamily)
VDGLDIEVVDQPYLADFVLCTGVDESFGSLADYTEALRLCAGADLPMLCADADRAVPAGTTRRPAAGALARRYHDLGGDTAYCGLPFPDLYERAFALLGLADHRRILAIGDGLATDIAGAEAAGLDAVLITGGLHREDLDTPWGEPLAPDRLAALCRTAGRRPKAALPRLVW